MNKLGDPSSRHCACLTH